MSETYTLRLIAGQLLRTKIGTDKEEVQIRKLRRAIRARDAAVANERRKAEGKHVAPRGHVYFIQAAGGGPIKIGHSVEPVDRMATLRIGTPVRLSLLASCPGARHDERNLHRMFDGSRVRGEWFRASVELISLIETIRLGGGLPWAHDSESESPQSRNPANSGADIRT